MVRKFDSGAILNSNLSVGNEQTDAGMRSMNGLTAGQVVEVIYVDDPRNRSKQFTEYNVLITEDKHTTSLYSNCRALDSFGGENNFCEAVYQGVTIGKRGKKDATEEDAYKDGSMVLVGFIDGLKESAVIIDCLQHGALRGMTIKSSVSPFDGDGSSTSRDDRLKEVPTKLPGATQKEGKRLLGEFNGVRYEINSQGELTIYWQGLKNEHGKLMNGDVQPTILKINKEGEFFIIDNLDQEIKISRKDQKITITDGKEDPNSVVIDRAKNQINVSATKVVVSGDTVHVGGKRAKESAVLGDAFLKLFNILVNAHNNHTHIEHDGPPFETKAPIMKSDKMKKELHLSENVKVDKKPTGKVPIDS